MSDRGPVGRLATSVSIPEPGTLTEGGILRPLVALSVPIVVTNLLHSAYTLADTFWLGRYSTDALASVTLAFPLVFLLISLGFGVSVAGSVLVAQYIGGDQPRMAEFAAAQTVGFAVVVSVALGLTGVLAVEQLLSVFTATAAVRTGAIAYLEVISAGLPLMFGFFMFTALMRGFGDTVTPMLVQFGTVVLNILLDPFLIFGAPWAGIPAMGVEGAAIATVVSRGLAFAVGAGILLSGARGLRIRPSDVLPDLAFYRRIVRIGVPASVEGTGRAISLNVLLLIVGLYSTAVVAAFGVGVRVFSVIFLPAIALARGVETMVGQNIGAGKPDRARATADLAARGSLVILVLAAGVVYWFAAPIIALFSAEPQVIAEGAHFLRVVAPSFGLIGVMRSYSGAFRGAGQTAVAAAISISILWGVRLPAAWIGSQSLGLGTTGIWAAFLLSNAVGALVTVGWFGRGRWRLATATAGDGTEGANETAPSVEESPATD